MKNNPIENLVNAVKETNWDEYLERVSIEYTKTGMLISVDDEVMLTFGESKRGY